MKKTIALLLSVLTVLLLAVPALALTGYELFTRWEQDGYPEDVTGVFYNTETQCLAILLTDNTEARQKAIRESLWADSCGVSGEEEGNPLDRRAAAVLLAHGIRPERHEARRFSRADYEEFDDILCMEERNRRGILRLNGGDPAGKIRLLLDYTDDPHDIADPWYTGDFEKAYREIRAGCTGYLQQFCIK